MGEWQDCGYYRGGHGLQLKTNVFNATASRFIAFNTTTLTVLSL